MESNIAADTEAAVGAAAALAAFAAVAARAVVARAVVAFVVDAASASYAVPAHASAVDEAAVAVETAAANASGVAMLHPGQSFVQLALLQLQYAEQRCRQLCGRVSSYRSHNDTDMTRMQEKPTLDSSHRSSSNLLQHKDFRPKSL